MVKRTTESEFRDTIFYEAIFLSAASNYTEAQILIPALEINPQSDSIIIGFYSNDTSGTALNELLVDDVRIDFVSADHPVRSQKLSVYPSPLNAGAQLTITHDEDIDIKDIKIVDPSGKVHLNSGCSVIDENNITVSTAGLRAGIYCIQINGIWNSRFVVSD